MAVSFSQVIIIIQGHMSKQHRPSSCRLQCRNRYSGHTLQQQAKPTDHPFRPAGSVKIKISRMERHPALDYRPRPADSDSRKTSTASKSKFLEKYKSIRSSRESIDFGKNPNVEEELKRKEDFECNKKRLIIQARLNNGSTQNYLTVSNKIFKDPYLIISQKLRGPLTDRRHSRPVSPSIEFVQMKKISVSELIMMTIQGKSKQGEEEALTGYWKQQDKFVSLIPLARSEKVSFEHQSILPIYAEVTIKDKRYVISDQYKNCTLKNLIEEFGPFQEQLGKRYLKQIALGLQHMHFHRRGHNRLSSTAILYNKNGELFINAVRSTSFVLSQDELAGNKDLHCFAPEFLLSKAKGPSKSLKNDVWALGCLAILMLTPTPLSLSQFHPYNFQQFGSSTAEKMIDQLKQLHKEYFPKKTQQTKEQKPLSDILSENAKNFIAKCLQPLSDKRPSIQTLLEHQFLQGV